MAADLTIDAQEGTALSPTTVRLKDGPPSFVEPFGDSYDINQTGLVTGGGGGGGPTRPTSGFLYPRGQG